MGAGECGDDDEQRIFHRREIIADFNKRFFQINIAILNRTRTFSFYRKGAMTQGRKGEELPYGLNALLEDLPLFGKVWEIGKIIASAPSRQGKDIKI